MHYQRTTSAAEFIADPHDPQHRQEVERYHQEAKFYTYVPPGTDTGKGWGIPPHCKPPKSAFSFVINAYKKQAQAPYSSSVTPQFKFWVFSLLSAHFWWFRQKEGAQWVLNFLGAKEIPPFHGAYTYIYLDPTSNHDIDLLVAPNVDLRLFRTCNRQLAETIGSHPDDPGYKRFMGILQKLRDPNANRSRPFSPIPVRVANWISRALKAWFEIPLRVERDPVTGDCRQGGQQWALELKNSQGTPFYPALHQLQVQKPVAYRIQVHDENGKSSVLWCSQKEVRSVPINEIQCAQGMSSELALTTYTCRSCNNVRTCVSTESDQRCSRCYGTHMENGDRPSLNNCNRHECVHCPSYIDSEAQLETLKKRLAEGFDCPQYRETA